MNNYLLTMLFAGLAMLVGTAVSAAEKTGWFSDIPVITETTVNAELSFAFDSPSGRILVLFLETEADDAVISAAYSKTLSAIGWVEEDGRFLNQDEQLKLEKIKAGDQGVWRLTLVPAKANQLQIR